MSRVRVGVIGVGHLGQHHARVYASLPEAVLIGVSDLDQERACRIAERHATESYRDIPDLLKRVDAVSVAVPTSTHHAVAAACLNAGVHVLVEKPLAATPAEGWELVELAKRRKLVLQVGHVERFNPALLAGRAHVKDPGFIECHRLSPFPERGTDVDVVLDLMIHDLDILLSLSLGPVEAVRATGLSVLTQSSDIAEARLEFGNACVATLTASRISSHRSRRMRVFQPDGYVSFDYHARQATRYHRESDPSGRLVLQAKELSNNPEDALTLELLDFMRAVGTGGRPLVSGEDGAVALDLAFQVLGAIRTEGRRRRPQTADSPPGS